MICFEPRLVCIAEDVLDTPDKGISKLISTISQHCSENNIPLDSVLSTNASLHGHTKEDRPCHALQSSKDHLP